MGAHASQDDYDLFLEDIEFRPGVTVDIHIRVFVNDEQKKSFPVTVFAVHGAFHTANTWEPLAKAVFEHNKAGHFVRELAAIDMPGKGDSGIPDNMLLGEMTLTDYATVIVESLERLNSMGIYPRVIWGHSMGGMVTQLVQQALVNQGSCLYDRFGIRQASLFASAMPRQIPTSLSPDWSALENYLVYEPNLGLYLSLPDAVWRGLFFVDKLGQLAPGAPTLAEIAERGYSGIGPFMAIAEVAGLEPYFEDRPSVEEGIFSPEYGTSLSVIGYEQDGLLLLKENQLLYEYLTDHLIRGRFIGIEGEFTVHDLHMSDPEYLIDNIPINIFP
jgi:pimeloyl-ACP methyl ester carboxylesterase